MPRFSKVKWVMELHTFTYSNFGYDLGRIEECSTCSHMRFPLKCGKSVTGFFWLFTLFYRKLHEGVLWCTLDQFLQARCFDHPKIFHTNMTYFISGQNVGKGDDDGKMETDLDGRSINFYYLIFCYG